jgi:putative nucleotidyltransferase with HDIG domain
MPDRAQPPVLPTELPPFPIIAIKALQLVSNEKAPLRELSQLISTDPAMSSDILRIANSALYGLRIEVESAFTAMILLGLDRIKAVVVTSALRHYIGKSFEAPWMRICWRHSLACALIAKELAKGSSIGEDVAYTAGVLHDIGRLALAVAIPERYGPFLMSGEATSSDILDREREIFGTDHCEAGSALMSRWDIPKSLVVVASHHHDPPRDGDPGVLSTVRHACRFADVLGFEVVSALRPKTYEELLAELPSPDRLPPDPEEFAFQLATRINSIETT